MTDGDDEMKLSDLAKIVGAVVFLVVIAAVRGCVCEAHVTVGDNDAAVVESRLVEDGKGKR